jgi:hypothetical protein
MSMTNWGSLEYRLRDSDSLLRDINVSNIAAQQEMDCLMSYVLVSEVHVLPCQARLSRMRAAPKGFANTHTTRTTVRIRVHKKRSLLPATPKRKMQSLHTSGTWCYRRKLHRKRFLRISDYRLVRGMCPPNLPCCPVVSSLPSWIRPADFHGEVYCDAGV